MSNCAVCSEKLDPTTLTKGNDQLFHRECFCCNSCLQPLDSFIQADDNRLYCESDYYKIFGNRCARCGELIIERLIEALDLKWHSEHFTCDQCGKSLAGGSYVKRDGRPFCKECNQQLKVVSAQKIKAECNRCKKPILQGEDILVVNDEKVHAHHYTCALCKKQLKPDFKMHQGQMYCVEDYARATAPSCYVCKAPIYGRIITALQRSFHPEHFICSKCEKPFPTSTFWEFQGRPFCEQHYNELASTKCARCFEYTKGKAVSMMNKKFCENHFACFGCDQNLAKDGAKFLTADERPYCSRCFDMIPSGTRKKMFDYAEIERKARGK